MFPWVNDGKSACGVSHTPQVRRLCARRAQFRDELFHHRPVCVMGLKSSAGATSYATFDAKTAASPFHPQEYASCFSRLLLGWVTPIMALGHTKQLVMDDLWPLRRPHQAESVSPQFASYFKCNNSIPKSFLRTFGKTFVLTGVAFLISMLCNLMGPIVLNSVVSSLTAPGGTSSISNAFSWVLALVVAQVMQALADN